MISEKSDSTQAISRSNDGLKWSEDETVENSDDDVENDEIIDDEYDDNNENINETVLKVVKVIILKK